MSVYRWLLRGYPSAFYRQFAADMAADYDDGYAAVKRNGGRSIVAFMARCYGDLFTSLLLQWLRTESLMLLAMSVAAAVAMWGAAFYVAAHEWPNGPATSWFIWQLGAALTAGSVLTQSVLRINR